MWSLLIKETTLDLPQNIVCGVSGEVNFCHWLPHLITRRVGRWFCSEKSFSQAQCSSKRTVFGESARIVAIKRRLTNCYVRFTLRNFKFLRVANINWSDTVADWILWSVVHFNFCEVLSKRNNMSTAVMPQSAMYDFGDIMLKVTINFRYSIPITQTYSDPKEAGSQALWKSLPVRIVNSHLPTYLPVVSWTTLFVQQVGNVYAPHDYSSHLNLHFKDFLMPSDILSSFVFM